MIIHNDAFFSIIFGDDRNAFDREYLLNCSQEELWNNESIAQIKRSMRLRSLLLLRQTHSDEGYVISPNDPLCDKQEGDYLITQLEGAGLGVYTADCLPIIFYDTYNRVIGITHAGWSGSLKEIAVKTVEKMYLTYGTNVEHLKIYFGPSAKVCCYEVAEDFLEKLEPFEFREEVIVSQSGTYYFDLPLFNRLLLESLGIKKAVFHTNYNVCTICDTSFCSNRRNPHMRDRQLTVVALKSK